MHLVASSAMHSPGVCTLCEAAPQEGEQVIFTGRIHDTDGAWCNLRGDKYVCKPCLGELLKAAMPTDDGPIF